LLDEPVTSLDVSVRAQIMNLLSTRAQDMAVTYAVISHDLTAIYYLTDYLYIVYRGLVVEEGPTEQIIAEPLHPYTKTLVASVGDPMFDAGTAADDAEAPDGACPYLPRCPMAMDVCRSCPPASVGPTIHPVRCWLHAGPAISSGPAGPARDTSTSPQRSQA
jgi:peptide/nickel transport system ATP-binding protein